jgi:hypothetical protein
LKRVVLFGRTKPHNAASSISKLNAVLSVFLGFEYAVYRKCSLQDSSVKSIGENLVESGVV